MDRGVTVARVSVVRTLLSAALLLVALAVGLVGLGSHWVDRVARTPEPMRQIIGPVASDSMVIRAIATELQTAAVTRIPELADLLPGMRDQLTELIGQAVEAAMADERVNDAWYGSIDTARAQLVTALDAVRVSGADSPTVWFPLTEFVELGEARLYELAGPTAAPFVDQMNLPDDLAVPLGRMDASTAQRAADVIDVAGGWRLYYGIAAALAVAGLIVGPRRGRWAALTVAAVAGLIVLFISARAIEFVRVPPSDSISGAIQARIVGGSKTSVHEWIDTAMVAGYGALALGVIGLVVAYVLDSRREDSEPDQPSAFD